MVKKLPEFLKGYFWSVKFSELDVNKDRDYIIHQILSFGDLSAIRWLFRTYGKKIIKNSFIKKSSKIYRPQTFNWVTKTILDLKNKNLNPNQYVINTPRNIR